MADETVELDLYAILSVPRDASEDDIKKAYRVLVQTYHPDKHKGTEMQEEAYGILSNPEQKAIYDIYGMEGLNAGMEITSRLKTPEEIRREHERLMARKNQMKLEARVNHRGSYVFAISLVEMLFGKRKRRGPSPKPELN
eukprot:gene14562-17210_t